jgi:hypothetical protein
VEIETGSILAKHAIGVPNGNSGFLEVPTIEFSGMCLLYECLFCVLLRGCGVMMFWFGIGGLIGGFLLVKELKLKLDEGILDSRLI